MPNTTYKKSFSKKNKTIRQRLHSYVCKKKDICCEEFIDRNIAIQEIITKYKNICEKMNEKDKYLSWINSDILKFLGYSVDAKRNIASSVNYLADSKKEDKQLWNDMDKKMYDNKELSEEKTIAFLKEVPLYFLLSFLGYASYQEKV